MDRSSARLWLLPIFPARVVPIATSTGALAAGLFGWLGWSVIGWGIIQAATPIIEEPYIVFPMTLGAALSLAALDLSTLRSAVVVGSLIFALSAVLTLPWGRRGVGGLLLPSSFCAVCIAAWSVSLLFALAGLVLHICLMEVAAPPLAPGTFTRLLFGHAVVNALILLAGFPGAVIWMLHVVVRAGDAIDERRLDRSKCMHCGYPTIGLRSITCPECGEVHTGPIAPDSGV